MERIIGRITALASGIIALTATAAAHAGEETTTSGHHMTGYGMFGGGLGMLFGAAVWFLIILGLVYLLQELTEDKE